jgi:hypothetical protein
VNWIVCSFQRNPITTSFSSILYIKVRTAIDKCVFVISNRAQVKDTLRKRCAVRAAFRHLAQTFIFRTKVLCSGTKAEGLCNMAVKSGLEMLEGMPSGCMRTLTWVCCKPEESGPQTRALDVITEVTSWFGGAERREEMV